MKNFLEDKLMPFLYELAQNRVLVGIRDGLALIIPLTVIGSIFLVISNIPIDPWLEFIGQYAMYFDSVVNVTFGVLGLLAAIGVGYNLGVQFGVDPISNAALSVVTFLLATLDGEIAINTATFDASGMFTAIVVAIVVTLIYSFFVKKHIVIKLPDGVPPAVMNSFVCLIPGLVAVLVVWFVRIVCGIDINTLISSLLAPLVSGIASFPGALLYLFLISFLWTLGIHGDLMLEAVTLPIFLSLLSGNVEALQAGQPIPNVMADGFTAIFVNIGGTGATLALVLLMLRSKAKRYNQLGKLAILPGLFNINEPVMFGFPIVMNPLMAIPFILVMLINGSLTYLLMYFGIIGKVCVAVPWTMPGPIAAFLSTNGSIMAFVWSLIEIVIAYLIYRPFFKKQEAIELENEAKAENNA
ncbi:MAG: PTS transporter subunit EIIC [Erysipelotrichaceae bacterium]|nr:PTS transporter subunit EIIC [Erysipelotrichaceae bacterium]MDY5252757.1 PTS transporter subunit EIIC [Erysipelotrichaceae bacterium]